MSYIHNQPESETKEWPDYTHYIPPGVSRNNSTSWCDGIIISGSSSIPPPITPATILMYIANNMAKQEPLHQIVSSTQNTSVNNRMTTFDCNDIISQNDDTASRVSNNGLDPSITDYHSSFISNRKRKLKTLQCEYCDKCFATNYEKTRHLRIHTGERPYKCPLCGKAFRQKQHMVTHKTTVHSTQKLFKCNMCSKEFKGKGSLSKHIKYQHEFTDNNTLKCMICGKDFKRKGNLKTHLKHVHSNGFNPHARANTM